MRTYVLYFAVALILMIVFADYKAISNERENNSFLLETSINDCEFDISFLQQRDTTSRRPREEPKTTTTRVPKSEPGNKDYPTTATAKEDESFLSSCISFINCISLIGDLASIFSSKSSPNNEPTVMPTDIKPEDYGVSDTASQHDTPKIKMGTDYRSQIFTPAGSESSRVGKVTTDRVSDFKPAYPWDLYQMKKDSTEQIIKEIPKADTLLHHEVELKPEPMVTSQPLRDTTNLEIITKKPTRQYEPIRSQNVFSLDWSRWYLGINTSYSMPSAFEESEYNGGLNLCASAGVIVYGDFEINLFTHFGWYGGDPTHNYITTTTYQNGDVDSVFKTPQKTSLQTEAYGFGIKHIGAFSSRGDIEYFGWGIGGAVRYMKFSETADIVEEKFFNGSIQSLNKYKAAKSFWKTAFSVEGMLSYIPSSESFWWVELNLSSLIVSNNPSKIEPLSMDNLEYKGFFNLGLSIKFKLYDFIR
ncbi:MAG: hypothetical protein QME58_12125 [Bacteroidota bacterium]|nr:hypothetical protein [Bacteroidota bacterium]